MRKLFLLTVSAMFALGVYAQEAQQTPSPQASEAPAQPAAPTAAVPADSAKKFYIYKDKDASENHFIPSGWMGDVNDLKVNSQSTETAASGTTSIQITYSAKKSQGQGWAGVYWQSAQNNWGSTNTGYDLSDFNKLVFKAKGKNGNEVITTMKVGGITTDPTGKPVAFPDSASVEYGPIRVTKDWQEYSINLEGKDLAYINGGLGIIFNADQAGEEQTVYLDDVYFVKDASLEKAVQTINFPFYVYADKKSLDNHFIPSGWMPATAARDIKIDPSCTTAPYSGDTCIRLEYKNTSGSRWAGVYWQQPAGNWGNVPNAGYNLQGATKLTFWAKGETGNEMINEFKMGGMSSGEYPDSDSVSIGPIQLTKEWKKYEIDLRGRDLSRVIGGFCWSTNIDINNPDGIVFYIDEIRYEKD